MTRDEAKDAVARILSHLPEAYRYEVALDLFAKVRLDGMVEEHRRQDADARAAGEEGFGVTPEEVASGDLDNVHDDPEATIIAELRDAYNRVAGLNLPN